MKNVDVEIYLKHLIKFFNENPTDLMDLIGEDNKETFFKLIEEQCYDNLKNGDEVSLTRKQLIEITLKIKKQTPENLDIVLNGMYKETKFGKIWLN